MYEEMFVDVEFEERIMWMDVIMDGRVVCRKCRFGRI